MLYFGLSILEGVIDTNSPTFFHLGRTGTLNKPALSAMGVNTVPGIRDNSYIEDTKVAENLGYKLFERDSSVRLTYFGEDIRAELALTFIFRKQIPAENVTVVLLSDGSFSRNANVLRYADAPDPLAQLEYDRAVVREMIATAKSGNIPGSIGNTVLAFMLEMPNAYWWYNGASYLTGDVPALAHITRPLLDSGRIVDKRTSDLFAAVRAGGKIDDARDIFNMAYIAGCVPDNGKNTLVVTGTYTSYEMLDTSGTSTSVGGATLPELFNGVLAFYSDKYNIFYKGHPQTPTNSTSETGYTEGSAAKRAFFASRGIREISDAAIPSEMLMYLISGLYIGGYPGTTFQSSQDSQTLFFFSEPDKFFNFLPPGLNNPAYFLHGDTYFIYREGDEIKRTPVTLEQISR